MAVAVGPAVTEGGVGRVRITVSDTGIGISAQVRDKIFKPFSQGNSRSRHTRLVRVLYGVIRAFASVNVMCADAYMEVLLLRLVEC